MEGAKVIDWICNGSELILQFEWNTYINETRKTNNAAQREQTNQRRTKATKSQNKKRNRCENHLFE